MKLQIFVRSPHWLDSAGTRIRYRRLAADLAKLGCKLAINTMGNVEEGLKLNADIYVFSKCSDAAALMLADMLRESGACVGFDLFDDYVSNQSSLNFAHRDFYRDLVGKVDFFLCSTERMRAVALSACRNTPTHVLNDPFNPYKQAALAGMLERKIREFRSSGTLELLWFGNGNNPIFPVGVSDLAHFGNALRPFLSQGVNVRLKVLTNNAALDSDGLQLLRQLPLQSEIEEWSAEAETVCLRKSMLAFLPVNYQNFSIAKSLNRAITALTHGNQILTAGYPLYSVLEDFTYTDASEFLRDLNTRNLKVRTATLPALDNMLHTLSDPAAEARRLWEFLLALPSKEPHIAPEHRKFRAFVHGASSSIFADRLARSMGWLSLGTPLSQQPLPFDAHINYFGDNNTPELRMSHAATRRVCSPWHAQLVALPKTEQNGYRYSLKLPDTSAGQYLGDLPRIMVESRAARIVSYGAVMSASEAVYRDIFGNLTTIQSELEMPAPGFFDLTGANT